MKTPTGFHKSAQTEITVQQIEDHFARKEAALRTKIRHLKGQLARRGLELGAVIQVRNDFRRRVAALKTSACPKGLHKSAQGCRACEATLGT